MEEFPNLASYLEKIGSSKFLNTERNRTEFVYNSFRIYPVKQRYNNNELWIANVNGKKIRIDFILEYVMTGRVLLTKKYKDLDINKKGFEKYAIDFLTTYFDDIFNKSDTFEEKKIFKEGIKGEEFKKCLALLKE